MVTAIELQVISKLLTSDNPEEISKLIAFDTSYYSDLYKDKIEFIQEHYNKYGTTPDTFTYTSQFMDQENNIVVVNEPIEFLIEQLQKNKQHLLLLSLFNTISDLGSDDVTDAWEFINSQCDYALSLTSVDPLDLIKDAEYRSNKIIEFNTQQRIPTGFKEIDKLMYGGMSTVEELLLILARTNVGKSWFCIEMMESAQKHGFPVLYYSPEMQSSYIGIRFDTWRAHFKNNQLFKGEYSEEYKAYIHNLSNEETPAYVLEDKDVPGNSVSVSKLVPFVKSHNIKLLIIDGLSYMEDDKRHSSDYDKFKHICQDLFKLSKQYGCAVVVAVQANRETKDTKDEKGEPFPNLFNVEGSDHPGRICTQAFALRQVFDKHVLDIRLEKSRMANNQHPVLSYAWDPNTGTKEYIEGELDDDPIMQMENTEANTLNNVDDSIGNDISLDDSDDDLEF